MRWQKKMYKRSICSLPLSLYCLSPLLHMPQSVVVVAFVFVHRLSALYAAFVKGCVIAELCGSRLTDWPSWLCDTYHCTVYTLLHIRLIVWIAHSIRRPEIFLFSKLKFVAIAFDCQWPGLTRRQRGREMSFENRIFCGYIVPSKFYSNSVFCYHFHRWP